MKTLHKTKMKELQVELDQTHLGKNPQLPKESINATGDQGGLDAGAQDNCLMVINGGKGVTQGELRREAVGGRERDSGFFSTRNRFGVNPNWAKDKYGVKLDADFGNGLKLDRGGRGKKSGVDRQMLDVNKESHRLYALSGPIRATGDGNFMPLSRAEDFYILHDDKFFSGPGQAQDSNLENHKTEITSPDEDGKHHLSQLESPTHNNTNKSLGSNRSPVQNKKPNNRGIVKNSGDLGSKFRVLKSSKAQGTIRKYHEDHRQKVSRQNFLTITNSQPNRHLKIKDNKYGDRMIELDDLDKKDNYIFAPDTFQDRATLSYHQVDQFKVDIDKHHDIVPFRQT